MAASALLRDADEVIGEDHWPTDQFQQIKDWRFLRPANFGKHGKSEHMLVQINQDTLRDGRRHPVAGRHCPKKLPRFAFIHSGRE